MVINSSKPNLYKTSPNAQYACLAYEFASLNSPQGSLNFKLKSDLPNWNLVFRWLGSGIVIDQFEQLRLKPIAIESV